VRHRKGLRCFLFCRVRCV